MRLLEAMASGFIDTFGITQPSDSLRRRAAWFIAAMLSLVLAGLAVGAYLLYSLMRRGHIA